MVQILNLNIEPIYIRHHRHHRHLHHIYTASSEAVVAKV